MMILQEVVLRIHQKFNKQFIKSKLYWIPIIMLLFTFLSNFTLFNYVLIGNVLGYSILSNIILYFYFNNKKYCWLTRNIPISLILINIIDIIGLYIPQIIYSQLYNIIVCSSVITLFIIFEIKNRIKK